MGKGKAGVEGWVAVVKPGRVMFEMNGVTEDVAKEAMRLAAMKMPIRCKFMTKHDFVGLAHEAPHTAPDGKAKAKA
jgi:large subunit ribosomal protein L16